MKKILLISLLSFSVSSFALAARCDKADTIYKASKKNCPATLKTLIAEGGDVNEKNSNLRAPIHVAATISIFDTLKANGANVQARGGRDNNTALHFFVSAGKLSLVKYILNSGLIYVDARNRSGSSALHLALFHGSIAMTNILLDGMANPNLRDTVGWTPLFYSLSSGSGLSRFITIKKIKALVAAGIDINIQDNNGRRALDIALKTVLKKQDNNRGNTDNDIYIIADFLQSIGAKISLCKENKYPARFNQACSK